MSASRRRTAKRASVETTIQRGAARDLDGPGPIDAECRFARDGAAEVKRGDMLSRCAPALADSERPMLSRTFT